MTEVGSLGSRGFGPGDLEGLPEYGARYELIDGALLVRREVSPQHQGQLLEVAFRLRAVCPEHLQVLPAPVRFQPSDGLSLMPDVLVCRREDVGPRYVEQPPLLAIAVLSPVTRLVDTGFRRALYELSGVRSYWMFDPAKGSLTVLELEDGRYAERATVVGDEAFETDLPFPVRLVPAELIR